MPPTIVTTAELFAIDGPIGISIAVLLGLCLSILFAWTLRREGHILGQRNAVLFWFLRCAALGVVLWMLLAPMKVLVETSKTRRSIVVATDVSDSMQTIDPSVVTDDLRWGIACETSPRVSITQEADEAVAALGVAIRQLQIAREALHQYQSERPIVESISLAHEAIQRVRYHLTQIAESASSRNFSDKFQALQKRIVKMLDSSELQSFAQLSTAIKKNRSPPEKGWQEGLPDIEHRVTTIKAVLQELAASAAFDEQNSLSQDRSPLLSGVKDVSRLDRTLSAVAKLEGTSLEALKEKSDVRWGAFDQTLRWLSGRPRREDFQADKTMSQEDVPILSTGTDLSAVFEAVQKESQLRPCAAVFLFSDVAHNQPAAKNPREAAAAFSNTPVYVIPIGNTHHLRDVRLRSVFAPTVAMRNDDIVIEASLQAFECEGEVCLVQLLQDGQPIDQREVMIDTAFASRTVRFERQVPTLGTEQFRVSVVPIEGEATTENNVRDFEVNVTRNDIKLLLADEYPRWEHRYLTQLFRRDTKVECDELLFHPRVIATGRREATKSFPVTVDEWDQYDLVMLGDLSTDHLSVVAQESLVQYLQQRGGTLVLIAGPESMPDAYRDQPLGEVLPVSRVDRATPVNPGGYEFQITEDGREHQALMIGETEEENRVAWDLVNRRLPLPAVSMWRRPRAATRTLIAAVPHHRPDLTADEQNSAFLCWQPVGRGRIVYLSSPDSYRLRFLRGDRLHYRFWGQLLRWAIASDLASGTKFVRVKTDKSQYRTREAVQVTIRLADADGDPVVVESVSARITGENDDRNLLLTSDPQRPGEYHVEVRSLPPGQYRIEPVGDAVEALQRENAQPPAFSTLTIRNELSTELMETRSDRALAQQIADITGGQVIPPTAIGEILRLTNIEPIITKRVERRPMWVQWKYLWIVFGCLQWEWIVRRRLGLS